MSMFSALTSRCQAKTSSACASRTFLLCNVRVRHDRDGATPLQTGICGAVTAKQISFGKVRLRPGSGTAAGIFQRLFIGPNANAPMPRPAILRNSRRERLCFLKVMAPSIPVKWVEVNGHLIEGLKFPKEHFHLFQAFLAYFMASIGFTICDLRAGLLSAATLPCGLVPLGSCHPVVHGK